MDIKETMKEIYEINKKNGFWENEMPVGVRLMLVVSELSEALEADRKGRKAKLGDFLLISNEEDSGDIFKYKFETFIKDSFEDEIADAVIRLFDMAQGMGMDLEFHIKQKMRYNSLREYKHGKKY